MDFCDDVGYSVHDVEDAIALLRMDPSRLREDREVDSVIEDTCAWYGADLDRAALGAAWERLAGLPSWITSYSGAPADAAGLKNLTSQLIGRFVSAVAAATRDVFGSGPLTRYDADLIVPDETAAEILILKGAAVRYVLAPRASAPSCSTWPMPCCPPRASTWSPFSPPRGARPTTMRAVCVQSWTRSPL